MLEMEKMHDKLRLIVPIDVTAFCVGNVDAIEETSRLAGETLVYGDPLSENIQDFTGSNMARDLHEPPWHSLEAGIHLHWALPDALSHVRTNDEKEEFAALPNRWLVTRYLLESAKITTRSEIVISDWVDTDPPEKGHAIRHAREDGEVRFVGKQELLTEQWRDPGSSKSFRQWTGQPLNIANHGELAYTAYYPNCRSLFGFYDSLSDINIVNRNDLSLMYSVIGWYANSEEDPLQNFDSLKELQHSLGWSYSGDAMSTGQCPKRLLCYGTIQNLHWHPDRTYLQAYPPLQATMALGEFPEETISAFVGNMTQRESPFFEKITTVFQQETIHKLQQVELDQLLKLDQSLMRNNFHKIEAGSIYTIIKEDDTTVQSTSKPLIELPVHLAERLNQLNITRQQYDLLDKHVIKLREELFAHWYRLMQADTESQSEAYQSAYVRYEELQRVKKACNEVNKKLHQESTSLKQRLEGGLFLKEEAAPRYWVPNDPSILLSGNDITPPDRYGGDHLASKTGYLACRLTSQILKQINLHHKVVAASQFSTIQLPEASDLPRPHELEALMREACLLNTSILSELTYVEEASVLKWLVKKHEKHTSKGYFPSRIANSRWDGKNPWLPIYMSWKAEFLPLCPVDDGKYRYDYPQDFVLDHFRIDLDQGGGIVLDPSRPVTEINSLIPQVYRGWTLLSGYSDSDYMEDMFCKIGKHINLQMEKRQRRDIIVQELTGFHQALLLKQHSKQWGMPKEYTGRYQKFSQAVAYELQDEWFMEPKFHYSFNPLRAGFLNVSVQIVDAFGQKRDVSKQNMIQPYSLLAEKSKMQFMSHTDQVFLPLRLSEPSRLLFRWISASSKGLDEMNVHPATTPVCGWLVPNHLIHGLFVFNAQGKALGFLYLNGSKTEILWEAAPGDETTINQGILESLKNEHPRVRDLINSLSKNGAGFLIDFLNAVETAHDQILPGDTFAGLEAYVGRPIAIVQASLRLEVDGRSAENASWKYLESKDHKGTDNGYTRVKFPVRLGNHNQSSDGLIGFFRKNPGDASAYEHSVFYSEGADATSTRGVIQPSDRNLLLTVTPKRGSWNEEFLRQSVQSVLMLVDPRLAIHASTGILPTKDIRIPPNMYRDALSMLEFSFMSTPVLAGCSKFELPIPDIPEYQWSWLEKMKTKTAGQDQFDWVVHPDIVNISGRTSWEYTPQRITEGWLRLNPKLLEFRLSAGRDMGHSFAPSGSNRTLTLAIRNRKERIIKWNRGKHVAEGLPSTGSVFYLHLSDLIEFSSIHSIHVESDKFEFFKLQSPKYGPYWGATPKKAFEQLPYKKTDDTHRIVDMEIIITLKNVKVAENKQQARVYFDYYNVEGLNDGVYEDIVTLTEIE